MSNYMPDTAGTGEDMPSGKIVILEDFDGDGRMDKRSEFMDSLVLPRAICLIAGGVLVAEPPNLWFVENKHVVRTETSREGQKGDRKVSFRGCTENEKQK